MFARSKIIASSQERWRFYPGGESPRTKSHVAPREEIKNPRSNSLIDFENIMWKPPRAASLDLPLFLALPLTPPRPNGAQILLGTLTQHSFTYSPDLGLCGPSSNPQDVVQLGIGHSDCLLCVNAIDAATRDRWKVLGPPGRRIESRILFRAPILCASRLPRFLLCWVGFYLFSARGEL